MPSGIATNRTNISLPTEVSSEILRQALDESAVMRLARRVTLPGRGLTIPMISAYPSASWVDETDPKPVSNPTLGTKVMQGYTLAVIVPFSRPFLRAARMRADQLVRAPRAAGGARTGSPESSRA